MPGRIARGRVLASTFALILVGTAMAPPVAATVRPPRPAERPTSDSQAHATYGVGDVMVSTLGQLQWRLSDGTMNLAINTNTAGGIGFGADGSLYHTQFQYSSTVDKYDNAGHKLTTFQLGSCQDPASVTTDRNGNVIFGSGGNLNCTFSYLTKFGPADNKIADYTPVHDSGWEHGPGWIAIEGDNCTVRYATGLSTIRRYNICTQTQLSNFSNALSLAFALQILPDGGMLVANWSNIVRLNSNGLVIQTYDLPGEDSWDALALDTTGGAFWAASFGQVNGPPATNVVHRIDLATGAELGSFATGQTGGVLGLAVFDANRFFPPGVSPGQTLGGADDGSHGDRPYGYQKDPVNTATGSYTNVKADLSWPGRGLPFELKRTYNSADPTVGPFGPGWTSSLNVHVQPNGDGSVTFVDEGGSQLVFPSNGSGGFTSPLGSGDTLVTSGPGWQLKRRDQVVYQFNASGQVTSIADRNANALTFSYTSGVLSTVTDTVGRVATFGYTGGLLTSVSGPQGQSVTFGYDGNGRLFTVVDVRGKTWTYTYDGSGLLRTIVDPNSHTIVTNTYGPTGRVIEQVDARGKHSTFAWDPATETSTMTDARGGVWTDMYHSNVLIARSDPLGNMTRYVYDDKLNLVLITDPRGNATSMTYDANRNLLTKQSPGSLNLPAEVWTYNARNDVLTHKDARGNTTTYTYTTAGNLATVTGPGPVSPLTQYTYDPAGTGLVFSLIDPRNKTTTYGYDGQANRNQITTPLGNKTTMGYDGLGRMTSVVEARGNVTGGNPSLYTTLRTYDAAGNLLTTTDPLSGVTTQTWDDAGNRLTVTDANLHPTTYTYDEANHLATVKDARNQVTTYGYDDVGNVTSTTDPKTHQTSYVYDLAGRMTTTTDAASHAWIYTYDRNGNVATKKDPNQKTTTYAYDALNRLTTITYADTTTPTATFAYDGNGNRTSMVDGGGTETTVYDTLDRATSITRGTAVFTYGYDAAGHVTSRTYPGQSAQAFVYDDDGRLTSANGATYTYDPAAHVATATTPDGVTSRYTWDRAGRMQEVAHTRTNGTLSRFTYAYDPAGNRTAMTTRQWTVTYRYDEDNRITEACWSSTSCPGGAPAAPLACIACQGSLLSRPAATTNPPAGETYRDYTYDAVGNRATEVSNAGTTTYAYDVADRMTSVTPPGSGAVAYSYDANGNQTAAGARTFTYDLADRTKTATVGTTTETYTYDGAGLLFSAATGTQANKTTKFLWDRSLPVPQLALERNGSDTLQRSYRYAVDRISQTAGSTVYYYHHDGLGSVSDVATSAGASLTWSEYYPYGAIRQAGAGSKPPAVDPFKFAGEQVDQVSGLAYLRARMYDQGTGRFLSLDPATPAATDPAMSSYVYGVDNPVNRVDPTGRDVNGWCFSVEVFIGFGYVQGQDCRVYSDNGQSGELLVLGGGGGIGAGISGGGPLILHSDADEIYDLEDWFVSGGGSAVLGGGGSVEVFIGPGHCGQIVGGGTAGPVFGGEASGGLGVTWSHLTETHGPPKSICGQKPGK